MAAKRVTLFLQVGSMGMGLTTPSPWKKAGKSSNYASCKEITFVRYHR
jgi:hypothetical protein